MQSQFHKVGGEAAEPPEGSDPAPIDRLIAAFMRLARAIATNVGPILRVGAAGAISGMSGMAKDLRYFWAWAREAFEPDAQRAGRRIRDWKIHARPIHARSLKGPDTRRLTAPAAVAGAKLRLALRSLSGSITWRARRLPMPFRRLGVAFAAGGMIGVVANGIAGAATAAALPPPVALTDITRNSIRILDRNGELLYEYVGAAGGFRFPVALDHISPNLINATLAAEDHDFYTNPGVNLRGLSRAAYENLAFWEYGGFLRGSGGSSITQQVVKNLSFPGRTPPRNPIWKLREMGGALQLARQYSKEEILSWYLNSVFYGSGAYGAEAAAQRYFAKPAVELTLAEASFLAGIPNAPGTYDVEQNFEGVKQRQREVLDMMVLHGYLKPEEADVVFEEPLELHSAKLELKAPHFVMHVQDLLPKLIDEATLRNGLRVVTTLDSRLQDLAEAGIDRHLDSVQRTIGKVDGSLVAISPPTGEILAMVGGRWFFDDPVAGEVNNALALNQPGSAMKPITYLAAFLKGWSPATIIEDRPIQLDGGGRKYTLQNFDGRYSGQASARDALGSSLNVPAVKALEFATLPIVHDLSGRLGLTTLDDVSRYGLAFTLGGADVKLLDLTYVFSVFANGGEQKGMATLEPPGQSRVLDPTAVLRIEDPHGKVLWRYEARSELVVPEAHNYLITNILADNNARLRTFGLSNPLVLPGRPAAAKTGLTDDPRDAWTLGYTPQLAVGVWVGNKDNRPMPGASSTLVASPIWHKFMVDALEGQPAAPFNPPPGVELARVCKASGRPDPRCSPQIEEVFIAGQVPAPAAPAAPAARSNATYTTANGVRTAAQMEAELRAAGWRGGEDVVAAYARTTGAPVTLQAQAAPTPTARPPARPTPQPRGRR